MAIDNIPLTVTENTQEVTLDIEDTSHPYYVGARAYVTQIPEGAIVTVIDKFGRTEATLLDGNYGNITDITYDPDTRTIKKVNGVVVSDLITLSEVAISNDYEDLYNLPTIPTSEDIEGIVDEWIDSHPVPTVQTVEFIFPHSCGSVYSGDCNIIRHKGKVIMIDSHRAGAYAAIKAMLDDYEIGHIDYFILTHYHDDHYGNIGNLVSDGFIDAETIVYLPAEGIYLDTLGKRSVSDTIKSIFDNAGIGYQYATESTTIEWDSLKVSFYNCDADYFAEYSTTYTNYNDYSTLNLVEYGAVKALYTGDAMGGSLERALDNGFIKGHVDLYKVEHHGINHSAATSMSGNAQIVKRLIDTITPTLAVQPSEMLDAQLNNLARNYTRLFLEGRGTKLFAQHASDEYIEFHATASSIEVASGKELPRAANNFQILEVYVDINTTSLIQDGTQEHPFKELSQAFSYVDTLAPYFEFRFFLADGTYNNSHSTPEKNTLFASGARFRIIASSENADNVIIKNGMKLNNCWATFDHVTVDGGYLDIYDSRITLSSCKITNISEDYAVQLARASMLFAEACTFDTFNIGIYNSGSSAYLRGNTFRNGTTALLNSYGGRCYGTDEYNNYSSVTNKTLNANYGLGRVLTSESGTKIASGTDLNDYKEAGFYFCENSSTAQSLANCPIQMGFSMMVIKSERAIGGRVVQIIFSSNIYVRYMTSAGFQRWYVFTGTVV